MTPGLPPMVFIVDVEADGPCPGLYSMVSFGAVPLDPSRLATSFYGQTAPITDRYLPEALAISGHSREAHLSFEAPGLVMPRFAQWVTDQAQGRPAVFMSDNPAFDWQFINYYFHAFTGSNPFGSSARRIGDLAAGLKKKFFATSQWKSLRKTRHSHHPVDDARGNAEALLALLRKHDVALPGADLFANPSTSN